MKIWPTSNGFCTESDRVNILPQPPQRPDLLGHDLASGSDTGLYGDAPRRDGRRWPRGAVRGREGVRAQQADHAPPGGGCGANRLDVSRRA